ncbi:hypothetical protein SAMN00120144_0178 [Hymenobacter roseosalivarius DSM 11622]|uniref:Uncharacterized protein n=1 Tax=Hymenobacter roseosalivarius DSM 11622 TaxID=645990 RepID=A0A1W1W1Z2_9BACT|nr:hypothetical protein [Hymenobacter roseosalivarius]SMB99411.1 hypothetical protein SAMN00120144_0178 [Hymenobacter roseosalivarius DSM 11622]
MATFSEQQALVAKARQEHQTAQDEALHTREQLVRLQRQQGALAMSPTANAAALASVGQQITDLNSTLEQQTDQLKEKLKVAGTVREQLLANLTPARLTANLSAEVPVMLLPLRLEAKFVRAELWVRAYPDDLQVVTHESQLTENEVRIAQLFWTAVSQAAGDDTLIRAAWGQLVQGALSWQRAAWIVREYRPVNAPQSPSLSLPEVPDFPPYDARTESWSQPARASLMPDRLAFIGINGTTRTDVLSNTIPYPLPVGPDPVKTLQGEGIRRDGAELIIDEGMAWMTDFGEAIKVGMGVKMTAPAGFDKLLVLGLRFSDNEQVARQTFEELLEGHYYTTEGFSLVPNGTATNNTDGTDSGLTQFAFSPSESFDLLFGPAQFKDSPAPTGQTDGFLLKQRLGLQSSLLNRTANADELDQRDARAMHQALWHGTLGYFLEEMMQPGTDAEVVQKPLQPPFDANTVAEVRDFFLTSVSGRGPLPAFRIGNQPYGILPTSAYTKWTPNRGFETRLNNVLQITYEHFKRRLLPLTSATQKTGEPDKDLLEVLGLQASSVSFFQRYALAQRQYEDLVKMSSTKRYTKHVGQTTSFAVDRDVHTMLAPWVANGQVYDLMFFEKYFKLFGGVVERDKVPLSESNAVLPFLPDGRNYLKWLLEAKPDEVEKEAFGAGITKPNALLYLLLRHALRQAYNDSGSGILKAKGLIAEKLRDSAYYSMSEKTVRNSKLLDLYSAPAAVTGSERKTLAQFVFEQAKRRSPEALSVSDVLEALGQLADRPSAKLERAFAEHIDLCSYRLDAWMTGLASQRMTQNQNRRQQQGQQPGFYAGAYGWLENVRPVPNTKTPKNQNTMPPELRVQGAIIVEDSTNGGHVHAPSLTHAVAAAVLRNGYLTHTTRADADTMAVNLSSERVRTALGLIEGVNNGQYIGALLGYQFERELHEAADKQNLELDRFIFEFRRRFPLVDDRLTANTGQSSEAQAARNVVDGTRLTTDYRTAPDKAAFVRNILTSTAPAPATALVNKAVPAIVQAIDNLLDSYDAVGDLVLSESVYQVVQGNYDRAAGAMKSLQEGKHIPMPEILNIPRGGFSLAHKAVILLKPTDPDGDATPRAMAAPAVNAWLGGFLPDLATVKVVAAITRDGSPPDKQSVSMAELRLTPIDLLYIASDTAHNDLTELNERVAFFLRQSLKKDVAVEVRYTEKGADWDPADVSLFGLLPHLKALSTLLTASRPAGAMDLTATQPRPGKPSISGQRYDLPALSTQIKNLQLTFKNDQDDLESALKAASQVPAVDDPAYNLVTDNQTLDDLRLSLWSLSFWGLSRTMPHSVRAVEVVATEEDRASRDALRQPLLEQAGAVLTQMTAQLKESDKQLTLASALTKEEDILPILQKAGQALLGAAFRFLPTFEPHNAAELASAHTDSGSSQLFQDEPHAFPTDEWLYGIARVRPAMQTVETLRLLTQEAFSVQAMQLPYIEEDRWLGLRIPEIYRTLPPPDQPRIFTLEQNKLLLSLHLDAAFAGGAVFEDGQPLCGLLVDEWTEEIPLPTVTTGITAHLNRPNSEPPQALLLAVSPIPQGSWTWENLIECVTETFEMAKVRAVEPAHIDTSPFAQVLPAVLLAVTTDQSSLSTNLADNLFAFENIVKLATTKYNAII